MKRVMLIVAYDGTNYCGWQVQNNGTTIEGELNKALSSLLKEEITVIGASRTDSGVHALGNVAVFDTNSTIPPERMSYALNQRLPEDIVVVRSEEVPEDWHPRYRTGSGRLTSIIFIMRRCQIRCAGDIRHMYPFRWMWKRCRRELPVWKESMTSSVSVMSAHRWKIPCGQWKNWKSAEKDRRS